MKNPKTENHATENQMAEQKQAETGRAETGVSHQTFWYRLRSHLVSYFHKRIFHPHHFQK